MKVKIFTALFLVLGLIFLGGTWYTLRQTAEFLETAVSSSGEVVDFEVKQRDGENSVSYSPVVKFSHEGEVFQFTSPVSANPPAYEVGDAVEILLDPLNPEAAKINGFLFLWLFPLVFGVIGFTFILSWGLALKYKERFIGKFFK